MSQFANFAKPLNSTKSFKNSGSIISHQVKNMYFQAILQVYFSQVISVGLSVDELDKICVYLQLAHITFSHMLPWKWHHVAGSDYELTCILRDNGSLKSYDNFPILSRDEVALPIVLVMYAPCPNCSAAYTCHVINWTSPI